MAKSIKQRLISGGLWAFGGRLVLLVSGLIVSALLARLLSPEEMGVYFLMFSLLLFCSRLAQLGMMSTVVRLISESLGTSRPFRAKSAIANVFLLSTASIGAVSAFLLLDTGRYLAEKIFDSALMSRNMWLVSLWLIGLAFQSLIAESFRGFSDIRLATVFDRLLASVVTACLLGWLWFGVGAAELSQVLAIIIASCGLSVLLGSALLFRRVRKLGEGSESVPVNEILKISLPLMVASLSPFLVAEGGTWILGAIRPSEEVAVFAAAKRLVVLLAMPLLIVNAVMAPIIAEMYAQKKSIELERYLRMSATMGGYLSLILIIVFIIFGSEILAFVYGDYYRSGFSILAILCVGTFANVWSGSCGQVLMMTGGQRSIMFITLGTGCLLITSTLAVVGEYGIVGVALVTSGVTTLQYILFVVFAKRHTGMWTQMDWVLPDLRRLLNR